MNNKGFTLTELLVVIAIIAILSIIVIPSVISVNRNINERLYSEKVEHIESSAELYGSNNVELFNGTDEVYVYVYELIESNYLTVDVKIGEGNCTTETAGVTTKGCMIDPRSKNSINSQIVILRKQNIGVVAEYIPNTDPDSPGINGDRTLVEAICAGFDNNSFVGKYGPNDTDTCKCNADRTGFVNTSGSTISAGACIIAGGNVNNNYLKYGSSRANWRVIGVYKLPEGLSAKIITSDPI